VTSSETWKALTEPQRSCENCEFHEGYLVIDEPCIECTRVSDYEVCSWCDHNDDDIEEHELRAICGECPRTQRLADQWIWNYDKT